MIHDSSRNIISFLQEEIGLKESSIELVLKLSNNNNLVELNGNVLVSNILDKNEKLYTNNFLWNVNKSDYILNGNVIFENKTIELVDFFEFNGPNTWWKNLHIIDFDYDGNLDFLADGFFGGFFNTNSGMDILWWENKNGKFVKHHEKNYDPLEG